MRGCLSVNPETLDVLAAELVAQGPDAIVTIGTPPAIVLKRATTTIPIVMVTNDPLRTGVVPVSPSGRKRRIRPTQHPPKPVSQVVAATILDKACSPVDAPSALIVDLDLQMQRLYTESSRFGQSECEHPSASPTSTSFGD
jgi:hypothetical protein